MTETSSAVPRPSAGPSGWEPEYAPAHLAAVVECSHDAIITKRLDGTVTTWNPAAERLYGYTADEAVGRHISFLAPPNRADEIPIILARTAAGERVEEYDTVRVRKDGSGVSVSVTASPVRDADGRVTGIATIAREIGERKRLEASLAAAHAELEEKNEVLQRSNAELEQFAYVASHDLSEPLRVISGYVQLLARRYKGRLDADADRFIDFAVDGCARQQRLIQDLLAYSRVVQAERTTEDVDIRGVVDKVLADLAPQISASGASVEVGTLPTIVGETDQLAILFQNLITNALKFSRPGSPPHVEVEAAREEAAWRFTVSDNGIGIEPQYRTRIFKIFQRLHTQDSYPGTGIGLAICHKVVERHGGRIWVDDGRGQGSRFCFTLPDEHSGRA